MALPEKIISIFKDKIQKMNDEKKKRAVLICTAVVVVILVLSVVLPMKSSKKEELPAGLDGYRQIAITPDELFLPEEPDFVPGVLLQREQRSSWTEEDAAVFWQDPLKQGEEQWREKLEAAVDEFLERVP